MSKNKCSFTFQELAQFIRSQPDERAVDMSHARTLPGQCGCVLVQFARAEFGAKEKKVQCGYSQMTIVDEDFKEEKIQGDDDVGSFIHRNADYGKLTYAQLKAKLPPLEKTEHPEEETSVRNDSDESPSVD